MGRRGHTFTKDASGKYKLTPTSTSSGSTPRARSTCRRTSASATACSPTAARTELLQSIFSAEEMEFQKVMNARKPLPVPPPPRSPTRSASR